MKYLTGIFILIYHIGVSAENSTPTKEQILWESLQSICGDKLEKCTSGTGQDLTQEVLITPLTEENAESPSVPIIIRIAKQKHFAPYKENFIIFGPREDNTNVEKDGKIQISMKHTLYDDKTKNKLFKERIYMGYTYKSIWQIWGASAPFEDHNFSLEFFYCSDNGNCDELDGALDNWRDRYYVGLEHESNGRDGAESRSWDRLYGRYMTREGKHAFSGKIWWIRRHSGNNGNIEDFLGYSEWQYFYRGEYNVDFSTRAGKDKGNILLGVSTNLGNTSALQVYIQVFSGYGESLLSYNQKRTAIRLGIRLDI